MPNDGDVAGARAEYDWHDSLNGPKALLGDSFDDLISSERITELVWRDSRPLCCAARVGSSPATIATDKFAAIGVPGA